MPTKIDFTKPVNSKFTHPADHELHIRLFPSVATLKLLYNDSVAMHNILLIQRNEITTSRTELIQRLYDLLQQVEDGNLPGSEITDAIKF